MCSKNNNHINKLKLYFTKHGFYKNSIEHQIYSHHCSQKKKQELSNPIAKVAISLLPLLHLHRLLIAGKFIK